MKKLLLFITAISLLFGLGHAQNTAIPKTSSQKEQEKEKHQSFGVGLLPFKPADATSKPTDFKPMSFKLIDVNGATQARTEEQAKDPCTITTFPWTEGFEDNGTDLPNCWTQELVSGTTTTWSVETSPHSGAYSAYLRKTTAEADIVNLVTPGLDLSGLEPTLTFWLKIDGFGSMHDNLKIYYKTSTSGSWTLLQSYTNAVSSWSMQTIALPDGSSDYYIAFEGTVSGSGYGILLDDIEISGGGSTTNPCIITAFAWTEGFENSLSNCWTQEIVSGSASWTTGSSNYDIQAHGGNYFARFMSIPNDYNITTKLITPTLELSNLNNPVLNFWYNIRGAASYPSKLKIYYKNAVAESWILLEEYTSTSTSYSGWIEINIPLPDKSDDYYIAFEGITSLGYQLCLDDIEVTEGAVTTIDIADATVTISPTTYPYTGAQILPTNITIAHNGNTLVENTDYTQAITSVDDIGTSAGMQAGVVTLTFSGIGNYFGTTSGTYNILAVDPCTINIGLTQLSEPFGSQSFPPECWTSYNVDGGGKTWAIDGNFSHSAQFSAIHVHGSYAGPDEEGWLVTPALFIPANGEDYILEFWSHMYGSGINGSTFGYSGVWISTNGADPTSASYTELLNLPVQTNYQWVKFQIPLNDYEGQTIHIGFKYSGFNKHSWNIDDVSVRSLNNIDVGVGIIIDPDFNINLTANEPVKVVLHNYGDVAVSDIPLTITLHEFNPPNPEQFLQTFDEIAQITIPIGGEYTYTTNGTLDVSVGRAYRITVTANKPGDVNTANNSRSKIIDNSVCVPITDFPFLDDFNAIGYNVCWFNLDLAHGEFRPWQLEVLNGNQILGSESRNQYGQSLSPYNWYVSPSVVLPTDSDLMFTFKVGALDWISEVYSVRISTTPVNHIGVYDSDLSEYDFTIVYEEALFEDDVVGYNTELMKTVCVPLADYAGQSIHIAIVHHPTSNGHVLLIDDIQIHDFSAVVDGQVMPIITPVTGAGLSNEEVKVLLRNNGANDIVNPVLTLSLNNTVVATETYPGSIASLTTVPYTFTQTIDLTNLGCYTIQVSMAVPNDQNQGNNTVIKEVCNFPAEKVDLFGYRLYDPMIYDNAVITFPSDNPANVTKLNDYHPGATDGIYAGEYVDGYLYCYAAVGGANHSYFVKIDTETWTDEPLAVVEFRPRDMTYDPTTGTMYGVDVENNYLVTIDLETGLMTPIGGLGRAAFGIACNKAGDIYVILEGGYLCRLDMAAGMILLISQIDVNPWYAQSMAFDHNTGRLFWASVSMTAQCQLIEIDTETGAYLNRGTIGNNTEVTMLHTLPLAAANDISTAVVTITPSTYTYTGSLITPSTITVVHNGNTLVEGTDYTQAITSIDNTGTSAGTKVGVVTLTFTGINTYSGTISGTYSIVSLSDINEIVVNGNPAEDKGGNKFYAYVDCNQASAEIFVDITGSAVITIDGTATNPTTVSLPNYGDNEVIITVGSNTYTLIINKPVPFEQIVIVRWSNTPNAALTLINNHLNNGGYHFDMNRSITWYRDGVQFHTGQSTHGLTLPSGAYAVEAYTTDGELIRTCSYPHTQNSMSVRAYPNPVGSGQVLYIDADMDEDLLQGATIDVYSVTGAHVDQIKVQGRLTTVTVNNYITGAYIFVLNGKDGLRKDLKVVVQ